MVECRYCGADFPDEEAHLDHLEAEHAGELGPIDRRKLGKRTESDREIPQIAYQIGGVAVLVVMLGLLAWGLIAFAGDSSGGGERVHEHGTLVVEVDGDPIDFDQPQYHEAEGIHFHPGDGSTWHMHFDRLTFAEAMSRLGMPVSETSVTIDETTYDAEDSGVSVTMQINDEPAELDRELREGDRIEIVVTTAQ